MDIKEAIEKYDCLVEAARRYLMHHNGKPLTKCWTGYGTAATYRRVASDGYMFDATKSASKPNHDTWWGLTPKGAKIIRKWIKNGLTLDDFKYFDLVSFAGTPLKNS